VRPPRAAVEAPPETAAPGIDEPELGDVAVLRDVDRPARRWSEALAAAAGIVLTVAFALACVWGLVRYTRTSPRFALRTIEISGASRRTSDDVARAAGVAPGQNVFSVNLDGARARLLEDPWIERATISRRLPSTLRIEVVEREAAALVVLGGDPWLLTRDGEPFKRLDPGDPFDLPVVTGVLAGDLARDRKGATDTIRRGLALAGDWERTSTGRRLAVQEIHVDDDGSFVLVVGKEAISLRMGRGPFRQAVDQAARVIAEAEARRAAPAVVFLDHETHPERVVVRMR
jgi:cell division protein FtsQ